MQSDAMYAVADFGGRVGNVFGVEAFVDWTPGLTAIIGAEGACGGNRDENSLWVLWIQDDRVQTHAAGAGLPTRACAMAAQTRQFLPAFSAVGGAKQSGVLHSGIDGIRIGQRRFEMPDAFELPGMLGTVVELMRGERFARFLGNVVHKLVALALAHSARTGGWLAGRRAGLNPGFSSVVGTLNDLSEPATGLGGKDSVRFARRTLDMINLPTGKVRAGNIPAIALPVGGQDKCAFACASQYSDLAHCLLL